MGPIEPTQVMTRLLPPTTFRGVTTTTAALHRTAAFVRLCFSRMQIWKGVSLPGENKWHYLAKQDLRTETV